MLGTYFLYTTIFVLAASFAYIAQYGSDASHRMWGRIFCFMCLFIPAALRYGIGRDYIGYCEIYDNNFPSYMQRLEPGFKFIGQLCRMAGLSSIMFMGVVAGITYALVCFCAPRKHIFTIVTFYVLSFLYLDSYDITRQALAISILLCGFSLFYNDHKIKGILLFAVASLIHYSSLIVFPVIIVSCLNINNFFRVGLIIVVIFIIINDSILRWVISIAAFINHRSIALLDMLITNQMKTGITIMILALPSVLILLNSKKISLYKNGIFILNVNAVYFAVMFATLRIYVFGRILIGLLFIPLFSIQILYNANKRYASLYHSLLILFFLALFFRLIQVNTIYRTDGRVGLEIAPYNSIFNR